MTDLQSVLNVVRQDLLTVRRTRLVQAVLVLYGLFVGTIFLLGGFDPDLTIYGAIRIVVLIGFLFVPLVSLLTGYLAIAGERESGTVRFLLGYPLTRGEVLLGKYVSRLGIVSVGIVFAFLIAAVGALTVFPEPQLAALAVFGGITLLFAGAYVGLAIAISAASGTRRRAMTGTVVAYFVFTLFWSRAGPVTVPRLVAGALDVFLGIRPSGQLWDVFTALSPGEAYFQALGLLPGSGPFGTSGTLGGPVLVTILCLWIVVPPALGYLSFVRADID